MVWALPRSLATTQGITVCFLFLPLLRCFSSRRSPRLYGSTSSMYWVAPFGNLRINGHLHLPEAYRSLSRPSSPSRAKASACCPFLLLLFVLIFLISQTYVVLISILRLSFQYLMKFVRTSSLSTLLLKTFNMSKIVESCDSWGELQLRTGLFHLFTLDHLSGIDNLASLREQLLYRPVLTASVCRTISCFVGLLSLY